VSTLCCLSPKNRRAVSQVMGSVAILGIVTSVGSVIFFNGMDSISAFTYDLSFHEASKNQIHREDVVFEHVRFEPNTDDVIIDLTNIGTVESTIASVTIVKIDDQEIIANWVDVNETVQMKDTQQIILDNLALGGIWNDDYYYYVDADPTEPIAKYKISLTTTRGNFFTTIASPFNT